MNSKELFPRPEHSTQLEISDQVPRHVRPSGLFISQPKAPMHPKTRADISFNTLEGSLTLDWFRLQQLARFDISSRLSADLGFLVYTRNNLSVTRILPRLSLNLQPYCDLEFTYGTDSAYAGVHKTIKDFHVSMYIGMVNHKQHFEAKVRREFAYGVQAQIKFAHNISSQVRLKKKLSSGEVSYSHENKGGYSMETIKLARKIAPGTHITLGAEILNKATLTMHKSIIGVKLDLSSLARIAYYFEYSENDLIFRFSIKRGGFHISIPTKIQKIPVLIACVATAALAYLSSRMYNYFVKDSASVPEIDSKSAVQDYVLMIKSKVSEMVREEESKNGLVIIQAYYGNKDHINELLVNPNQEFADVLDTTIPMNFLVDRSCLQLPGTCKHTLHGFWKICDNPELFIHYKLLNREHKMLIKDSDPLII